MKAILDLDTHWKLHTLNTSDYKVQDVLDLFPDYQLINVITSGNYLIDVFLDGCSVGYFFIVALCRLLNFEEPPLKEITDKEVEKNLYVLPLFGDFE